MREWQTSVCCFSLGRPQISSTGTDIQRSRGRRRMSFLLDGEDAMDSPGCFHPVSAYVQKHIYPRQRYASQSSWLLCHRLLPVATATRDLSFLLPPAIQASDPSLAFASAFIVIRMLVAEPTGELSLLHSSFPSSACNLGIVVMKRRKPRHHIDAAGLALSWLQLGFQLQILRPPGLSQPNWAQESPRSFSQRRGYILVCWLHGAS